MSAVIATPPFKLTDVAQGGLQMLQLQCIVKLLDQLRWRHRSLKLPALPENQPIGLAVPHWMPTIKSFRENAHGPVFDVRSLI